jgi:hypothetical protein
VNYDQLPEFVCGRLLSHFGMTLSAMEVDRMRLASRVNAKTPQITFSDDRQAKRLAVTPALQTLVDRWLSPVFERLETASTSSDD